MLDFLVITKQESKKSIEIFPKFIIKKSKDLMIRGGDFYAIWLENENRWSTNEQDVIDAIDRELDIYVKEHKFSDLPINIAYMWDSSSGTIDRWHKYVQKQMRDNYKPLDEELIFANDEITKESYASRKLSFPLYPGPTPCWDTLIGTLYSPEERHKIEWAIGAIVTGYSKKLQKFLVLYGPPGSGKSTILNIIQGMFDDYCSVFDAESLGSTDTFALEQFKSNPLISICQDGDLSHIERNARLNSLISHEKMTVNEKYRSSYTARFNAFLLMATNKVVRITDAKSGMLRRLIDVNPSGEKIPTREYNKLMKQVEFEYGAIAAHCKNVFMEDIHFYDTYKPIGMMGASNDFFNYVEDSYAIFKKYDSTSLKEAWDMYKVYCEMARVQKPFTMRVFKEELKNYFVNYEERKRDGEDFIRSYYSGFRSDIFDGETKEKKPEKSAKEYVIDFKEQSSIFDEIAKDYPAQLTNDAGTPSKKWEQVTTTLKDINSKQLHYVKVPVNHIVIDFDIKDEHGEKSFDLNLKAASQWPKTYAELSKSGTGIHLHYIYTGGNPEELSRIYDNDIEVKVFTGNSSVRRMLTKCNNLPIAGISSGLPKKERKMVNFDVIKNEKALRTLIKRNLNKEYHASTKCSIDFINDSLEQAYNSGMHYDVSDMRNVIYAFAAHSTHQSDYCTKLVRDMKFKSDDSADAVVDNDKPIVFYDVEVFPNLLLINWKFMDTDKKKFKVNRMINPSPHEIEELFKYRLVGFNCRKYDNHIIYAGYLGKNNQQIYQISQKIVTGDNSGFFGEAYNLSYTDIYDYAETKQSLKKWEIDLGLHHQELGMDWDKPVPEELWEEVAAYCDNDVISTEAVWNATQADFKAREILVEVCHTIGVTNMTVNDTTNTLTTKIVFRNDKNPDLNYVKLEEEFPGYEFVKVWDETSKKYIKKNMYRGVDLGFGGYVYAEPGMYGNVALLDVASLHPHSIIAMNLFGKYTQNFKDLVNIRILIKHKDLDGAAKLFDGALAPYLTDINQAKQLSKALKIAINSVYGLTSAAFKNPFKDDRNENNIVALRGALFMKTLQDKVQAKGFKVCHIKTDSIKIPDATPEIIEFCMKFAKEYGYTFEHEATYDRICLVNDAVYIAKYKEKDAHPCDEWTATGTQFQVPYVFKTCFSHEPIDFKDLCETKQVKTIIYLADNTTDEIKANAATPENLNLEFIGRIGLFCPISQEDGGKVMLRKTLLPNGGFKLDSVVGTKGYTWLETEYVMNNHLEDKVDLRYYNALVDKAIENISQYGDYEWFVSNDPYKEPIYENGHPNYELLENMPF